jgi:hypothetical protein
VAGPPPRRRRGAAGRAARRKGAAAPVQPPHDPSGFARRSLQCRPPLLWPRRPLAPRSRPNPSLSLLVAATQCKPCTTCALTCALYRLYVQASLPVTEDAAGAAQQTEPEPQPAGGSTKKDKEKLRKERQRQRKMEEVWEALRRAVEVMEETADAGCVDAVEEAMQAAAKHEARSEPLAALVAEARELIEQARAAEAERARVAAEAAAVVEAAAAAEEAAERQQAEGELAALTARVQQVQARLGVPPAAPAPHPGAEETMCVVSFDAPKEYAIVPCGHQCVCGPCAEQLTKTRTPTCPVCRGPIRETMKVFCT